MKDSKDLTPKEKARYIYNKVSLFLSTLNIFDVDSIIDCGLITISELQKNTVCSSEFGGEEIHYTYQYWDNVSVEFLILKKLMR